MNAFISKIYCKNVVYKYLFRVITTVTLKKFTPLPLILNLPYYTAISHKNDHSKLFFLNDSISDDGIDAAFAPPPKNHRRQQR